MRDPRGRTARAARAPDRGGLGPARWLRPPALDSATRPPEARLLLGTLAYLAHRARA
ncbi:hypothetical protein [Streptomyces sp. NBC_00704]|uniref:hypothetical protein n=1 Tax=Streptomyces sp. NBC_00704 TaxID=2975809 RepID=UPI003FA7C317